MFFGGEIGAETNASHSSQCCGMLSCTDAYSSSCCAAHAWWRPTAVAAALRTCGVISQLGLLCVHRHSHRLFRKLSTKLAQNQDVQNQDQTYAHNFDRNAIHITKLHRHVLKNGCGVWALESEGPGNQISNSEVVVVLN